MGCSRSRIYHDNEVGVDHKDLALTAFTMQTDEVICDLDTDNDQRGKVAVDCIFRPTREIYGQRALDMIKQTIVWSNYEFEEINPANLGIEFQRRPFPHDFPAFAHEKPAAEMAQLARLGFPAKKLLEPKEAKDQSLISQVQIAGKSSFEKIQQMTGNETIEDVATKG